MTRALRLAVSVLVAAVVGAACGGSSSIVGTAAPKLAGTTLDGGHVDLASYRGKPALVLFGASYCEPCRKEWPDVAKTAAAHPALSIIGVSYEDSRSIMRSFTESIGVKFPVVDDPNGTVAQRWGVHGIPQAFFVDGSGKLTAHVIGERPYELHKALAALLRST